MDLISFEPLELQLWRAADNGDLETLLSLLSSHPSSSSSSLGSPAPLDVNWLEVNSNTTPLARACLSGHVDIVRQLLRHPEIDANQRVMQEVTPLLLSLHSQRPEITEILLDDPRTDLNFSGISVFYAACAIGALDYVRIMMKHKRVIVDAPDECGATPFLVACGKNQLEVVNELIRDPRINKNAIMIDGQSAVSLSVEIDAVDILALLIAMGGNDLETRHPINVEASVAMDLPADWKDLLRSFGKPEVLPREIAEAKGHLSSLALLNIYETAPNETRYVLWRRLEVQRLISAEFFSLIIFLCDDYLRSKIGDSNPKMRRFLKIAQGLPIEIQMTLCNRMVGLTRDLIPKEESEAAFKTLAWKEMLGSEKST